jgi:bifunctional non-homologous end joining protein LigD
MSLEEYKRKRRFEDTPEPAPKVEKKAGHRFVVQKHRASHLHYDFRLELDGVLKSWAVPRGPSLDPDDKRLAMHVEDHPVSYFDFEGTIPEGNYGAGTVMVWDVGRWQPLSPVPVKGKYVPGTDAEASAMLAKGDLKFRLQGKRLKGDFALVKMRGRRPGSKGNEWLLIKKHDDEVVEGFDIEGYDTSVLTKRTMKEIGGDEDSAQWTSSRPASRGKLKAAWLADTLARVQAKKKAAATGAKPEAKKKAAEAKGQRKQSRVASPKLDDGLSSIAGAKRAPMPTEIQPMLANSIESAFDDPAWLFEIKWDGYRAVAFIDQGKLRLVSRNQNDLTAQYAELRDLPRFVKARSAVIDGEIVALDEQGRPSFSLMQQRTGFRPGKSRLPGVSGIPVVYYAFDLLYLDGYDLRRVPLEQRKRLLAEHLTAGPVARYSDHYEGNGKALLEAARAKGLEGIVAKRRASVYEEKRSSDWRKIKIMRRVECVIGGYTDPEGSRDHLGSIVLGLYDSKRRLIPVGQAGSGFDQRSLRDVWERLQKLATEKDPFYGEVDSPRRVHFVRPELVAEIQFTEWTHETAETSPKLRAPVFLGLRPDKSPKECTLEQARQG